MLNVCGVRCTGISSEIHNHVFGFCNFKMEIRLFTSPGTVLNNGFIAGFIVMWLKCVKGRRKINEYESSMTLISLQGAS